MGLFANIKAILNFGKEIKRIVVEEKEREKRFLAMSSEELSALSDDELLGAVVARAERKVESFDEIEEGLKSLNESELVCYTLNWFETEVNNGGLCQFFVNSSSCVAPYVIECMEKVGADQHKRLFEDFVSDNGIDLNDLSFFKISKVNEFEKKLNSYPFEKYDEGFYDMEPLETYLKRYARAHCADF